MVWGERRKNMIGLEAVTFESVSTVLQKVTGPSVSVHACFSICVQYVYGSV